MKGEGLTCVSFEAGQKRMTLGAWASRRKPLYIKILLLPLHSLTTSRKWNKADQPFVPRQILMFCPHSLTSESGQFTGL